MGIYENIVIGNFLYSLGVAMGVHGDTKELPLSVNLLQQTPLDRGAGDVLVRGACVMRLIEFKRKENKFDRKELAKLLYLQLGLSAESSADLVPVSRDVHWYIESSNPIDALNVRILPYLDLQNASIQGPDFQQFIDAMVADAVRSTPDKSAIYSRYLRFVATCHGAIKGSSGGLIVSVDVKGTVNYAVVEDLGDLGLSLTKFHGKYLQRQNERQQVYEKQWERTYSGIERGEMTR